MRPPDLDLAAAWQATWDALALPAPADALAALCTAWAAPGRHYHTLQHLQEGLVWFAQVRAMAERPGEVGLALWFHDAVYDPRAHDNEARSADWAVRVLAVAGAPAATRQRVRALIMATCHTAVPQDPDARLLVDIDLSILGAAPARFAEYDAQIRAEYAWVPAERYRHKRRAVLQGFLQRPVIYTTAALHAALEAQARVNLRAALGWMETRG